MSKRSYRQSTLYRKDWFVIDDESRDTLATCYSEQTAKELVAAPTMAALLDELEREVYCLRHVEFENRTLDDIITRWTALKEGDNG